MPKRLVGTEPAEFDVVIARRVTEAGPWAGLNRQLEKLVGALPAHRDSASGRRNAGQVRLVMLVTGTAVVVLWNSPWAPAALLLCLAALVLPMPEPRRRQMCATLRAKRQQTRVRRSPGHLEVTATHLILSEAAEPVRKLRRKVLKVTREGEHLDLVAGAKKRERIAIHAMDADSDDDLWLEGDRDGIEGALRA